MDSILISGGAGFIGTNITKKLINQGHRVIILDNFLPPINFPHMYPPISENIQTDKIIKT